METWVRILSEKSQKYSFIAILVQNPEKSQSYQATDDGPLKVVLGSFFPTSTYKKVGPPLTKLSGSACKLM